MQATIEIYGKRVHVKWSEAAEKAMSQLDAPLLVEMELLFSCMIRKAVRFREDLCAEDFTFVTQNLRVRFHPVMTKACSLNGLDGAPPLEAFPIKKPSAFVPRELFIDIRRDQWVGEYQI